MTYEAYFTRRLLEALTLADEAPSPEERSIHLRASRYYRELLQCSDSRQSVRHSVKISALVHHIGPEPRPVVVTNLSACGFRITLDQDVHPGRLVALEICGLATFDAYVVWQNDCDVGCKFLAQLHPALLDAALAISPQAK